MSEKYRQYFDKEKRKKYNREYQREYYRKHFVDKTSKYYKDKKKSFVKYQHELRKKAINVLGGPVCANCGCTVYRILEINHKEGGGRKEAILKRATYDYLRKIAYKRVDITKYDVLCRVCNALHYVETILGIKGFKISWEDKNALIVQQIEQLPSKE